MTTRRHEENLAGTLQYGWSQTKRSTGASPRRPPGRLCRSLSARRVQVSTAGVRRLRPPPGHRMRPIVRIPKLLLPTLPIERPPADTPPVGSIPDSVPVKCKTDAGPLAYRRPTAPGRPHPRFQDAAARQKTPRRTRLGLADPDRADGVRRPGFLRFAAIRLFDLPLTAGCKQHVSSRPNGLLETAGLGGGMECGPLAAFRSPTSAVPGALPDVAVGGRSHSLLYSLPSRHSPS